MLRHDSFPTITRRVRRVPRAHTHAPDAPTPWLIANTYWELAWDKWTAAYSGTLIYIGLPASMQVSGWVHPKNVYYGVAPVVQKAPNYGGFMLWDRYYDKQDNYSSYIKYYA